MKFIKKIPFFIILLIFYNIIAFSSGDSQSPPLLKKVLFEFGLISGAVFVMDVETLLIIIGLMALFFEIFRATRSSKSTIINYTVSLIVSIVFLIEFIVTKQAGTTSFFILTCMSLMGVVTGFTVSMTSARRDIVVDR